MDKHLQNAKWIWCTQNPQYDEYGEFVDRFVYAGGKVTLQISADSNYAAYVNGRLAAWGQYADRPYDKVFDEVDVTPFCREGENRLAVIVWYYGLETTSVYYPGNAGLLYALVNGSRTICESGRHTLCRMSPAYGNHRCKSISGQLGYSFYYDAAKADQWLTEETDGFYEAYLVEQELPLRPRPCDKLTLLPEAEGKLYKTLSDNEIIFDLGREQVGFLVLELVSPVEQDILISYGEHLDDGCVRRKIGDRDFSVEYRAAAGENRYMNPFRRLACRYLQVYSEHPLEIRKIAIAPTMYVLEERPRPVLTPLQNKIYDICVETLHLCMHEHYEDCPWREQALYAMDSRNQMLCGYYAFGEYRFPRSNLELISKDDRADGLLSICSPIKLDLVIPSFSLHYITACREYMEHSGDTAFLREIFPKLESVIAAFTDRLENGLIRPFEGENYWNFYEWTKDLDNWGISRFPQDLLINAMLSNALENMAVIADTLHISHGYRDTAAEINTQIRRVFWDADRKLFLNFAGSGSYSQLGNALAVICGAVTGEDAVSLCEKMLHDTDMTRISLSMRCFLYDALLKVSAETYREFILADIEAIYLPMLNSGSTTVWETERVKTDFGKAGSLCHGWSAMPIYYYHKLLG